MGTYNSNFISGGQIYALTIKCMYAWSTTCFGSFSLSFKYRYIMVFVWIQNSYDLVPSVGKEV